MLRRRSNCLKTITHSTLDLETLDVGLWTLPFGSLTSRNANNPNHKTPDVAESRPAMIVSVRGVIDLKDQPETAVEKLQISNSLARSVVPTRPRKLSGTGRISSVSWNSKLRCQQSPRHQQKQTCQPQ